MLLVQELGAGTADTLKVESRKDVKKSAPGASNQKEIAALCFQYLPTHPKSSYITYKFNH